MAGGTLLEPEKLPVPSLSRRGLDLRPVVLATAVLAAADLDEALLPYQDAVAEAHRSGSILAFAQATGSHLHAFLWRGELAEAEAEGREAVDACETWGSPWSYLVAFLANALMEQGKLDIAAAALARAGADPRSESGALVFMRESHARLSILRGDVAGGLAEFFEVGRLFEAVGGRNPALFAWRSQAALARPVACQKPNVGRVARAPLLALTSGVTQMGVARSAARPPVSR